MKVHDCPACGQRIIRALTEARRWQWLDPLPDASGNVAAYKDAAGTWHARTLADDQVPSGAEKRFLPHFASSPKCGEAARHQAQRDQVKTAQSAQAKAQRNQRGRRPGPQITGVRIPAPIDREGTA